MSGSTSGRKSRIEYGQLVENALRTVVREVLERVATEGLQPPHYFYITFRTEHPGVEMPGFLRDRYPAEMTVVLQHQYWDLEVEQSGFSVTLSFNDQLHRLQIPFDSVKVFADPGVEFGLQFTLDQSDAGEVTALRPNEPVPAPQPVTGIVGGPTEEGPAVPEGGAEIVTLDRFRKK